MKCRQFYKPRKFSALLITAVYIPQLVVTNVRPALEKLHSTINSQLNAHPEGVVIVAGDFNHVELKAVFPKVYMNIPGAYKAAASSHLVMPDHISLEMTPAYRPLICRSRPTVKTIQVWARIYQASQSAILVLSAENS